MAIAEVVKANITAPEKMQKILTCKLCTLPEIKQATNLYFESGEDPETVCFWLKRKFNLEIEAKQVREHFNDHYVADDGKLPILLETRIKELQQRMASTERAGNKVSMIKEMMWEFLVNIYSNKPQRIKTNQQIDKHQKVAKQFSDLAKSYREYHEMELKVLGYGKTEEEQLDLMKNYVKSMLKKVVDNFADMPDAQKRLSEIINLSMSSTEELQKKQKS